jgi:putative cell wall-binding protein
MRRIALLLAAALLLVGGGALPAAADHTDPGDPITPTPAGGVPLAPGLETGAGEWEYHVNFPPNPSSDHWFFEKGDDVYSTSGTLGGGAEGHVGQRILRLTGDDGSVEPRFVADHGSAACNQPSATGNLGLQHDASVTPFANPELLLDATDSTGRCHDTPSGGIEIVDISGLGEEGFEPREIHLLRFRGTTHTLTVDEQRPWIVYSNNSTTNGSANFNDVIDLRSCLTEAAGGTLPVDASLEEKRESCRPVATRIPFQRVWTQGTTTVDGTPGGNAGGCHDTVSDGDRLFCSGGFGDVIFDVSDLTDDDGNLRGEPLSSTVVAGTATGAAVTDLTADPNPDDAEAARLLAATGVEFLGAFNHVGFAGLPSTNTMVPSDQGVAFSHESRRLPAGVDGDREFLVVTDERGGGALPGGATCTEPILQLGNEFGNGGLHVLDITDPSAIDYATTLDGDGEPVRAVWQGDVVLPSPTFCVIHRIQVLPDEQRIIMGYYSQGVKILDYGVDADGNFVFDEVASMILPGANSWTTDAWRITDNADGTRTYDMLSSDIQRGVDVFSWTGPRATAIGGGEPGEPTEPPSDPGEPGEQPRDVEVARVSGTDRFGTAIATSRASFERADTVFIARADDYADALTGGPLAASEGAPILLTEQSRLTGVTEDEITRLQATRAVLLGGSAAIDAAVADRLRELGLEVSRIGGANRFATAALIADELGDGSGTAFLTEGENADRTRGWPDAMSAAPYAAFQGQPILLVNRDRLPAETAAALEGVTEAIVVGGDAAVSDAVVAEVEAAGHGPRRLSGANRYATSRAVTEEAIAAGMSTGRTWLATGSNFPDALTAGAVVGARGDTLLLVDGRTLANSTATRDFLVGNRDGIDAIVILGGTGAISRQVEDEVDAIFAEDAGTQGDGTEGASAFALPGLPGGPTAEALLVLALAGLLVPAARVGRRRSAVPA